MLLEDISFPTPQENIVYDDVLLSMAEQGQSDEVLRFWESKDLFIVLGRIGKVENEVRVQRAVDDQIPILRRSSGGGTVLQGPGCLNYSLVLSKARHPEIRNIRQSYSYILAKVVSALATLGLRVLFMPTSDLTVAAGEKKFSGNAQKRGKNFILHHGTILYDFDLRLIETYLQMPLVAPDYRRGRAHLSFVTNLSVPADPLKRSLEKVFCAGKGSCSPDEKRKFYLDKFLREREMMAGGGFPRCMAGAQR
ncbi:MAG: lipoate--protein ligase family protein [Candidatus Omnitrophota bacterium]